MKMNKTVKKLDNNVIKALTEVCEEAKSSIQGFAWLTHTANYANFPASLLVTCVFSTEDALQDAKLYGHDTTLIKLIHSTLINTGILLKQPKHNVTFDTDEAGAEQRLL